MIKVLIADDERKIRVGLSRCIPWEEYGMEICALAFDGRDALEKAQEHQPDICLVDICMPILSGLEFVEKIHEACRDMICIVITGYDEFAYAQKAVKLGVFEYILKPVNEEEFLETVLRAKAKVEAKRAVQEKEKKTEKLLEQSFPILKEKFLNSLLNNDLSDEDIKKQQNLYDMGETESMYLCFIPCRKEEQQEGSRRESAEQLAGKFGRADAAIDEEGNLILLLRTGDADLPEGFLKEMEAMQASYEGYSAGIEYEKIYGLNEIPKVYSRWKDEKGSHSSEIIKKIKNYIKQHYGEPELTVSVIGEVFHVNTSYLSRTFKQEAGINMVDYITKIRMQEAEHLLNSTDMKVYEIAEKLGYKSQHYFCVAFKKFYKISPTEYRMKK